MEKLHWSRYNFLFKEGDLNLLFNSYSSCLLKLDNDSYEKLLDISVNEDKLNNLQDSYLSFFRQNYILVEDDIILVDKMQFKETAMLYSRDSMSLTIAPTQNCNFSCVYCFENNRIQSRMTDETEQNIIRYLERQITEFGLKEINLVWYGGEPLLEILRIKSLSEKILALNVKLTQSVITNGYLFDTKNVGILKQCKVENVQITLDGFPEIHDVRRPLKSGKPTFDRILRNIEGFFKSPNHKSIFISVRVNVDNNNLNDYLSLYTFLKNKFPYENFDVYPGWVTIKEGGKGFSSCVSINKQNDFCLSLAEKGVRYQDIFPKFVSICSVVNPYSMLIGPDGSIYKCWEDLDDKKKVVGNINFPKVWNNLELRAKYSCGVNRFNDLECRECVYLPICSGGCPIRRYENKYEGAHNNYCTYFKGRLKEYIMLHCKDKLKQMKNADV